MLMNKGCFIASCRAGGCGCDQSQSIDTDAVLFQLSRKPQFLIKGRLNDFNCENNIINGRLFMNRTAKLRNVFSKNKARPATNYGKPGMYRSYLSGDQ